MKYFLISLFIFILGILGTLRPLRGLLQQVSFPIQLGLKYTAVNIKDGINFLTHVFDIHKENLLLAKEMLSLKSRILELEEVSRENDLLREQLAIEESSDLDIQLILAEVLRNPRDLTGASIFVNKGSKNGVAVGDLLILEKYLVGKIVEVTEFRSLAILITSREFSAAAVDLRSDTEGIVLGNYSITLEMTRILPQEDIIPGDLIISSGKDGIFLPGFVLGIVDTVLEDPAEPLKSAQLRPALEISTLQKVFILPMAK